MGIYRGAGGTGDAVNDASSEALLTIQARDAALAAKVGAETAQTGAQAAQAAAQLAQTNAETAETNAETAETNAETAATNAASSASSASTSASNASSSASAASTSASNASTSATNASNSASAASTSATNAAASASTATTQATNASNSASAAATSATNASNSASAASTSATNAANSATAAQTAETNAETAETNAAASASAASTSASNAASSASSASTSASNAATSATNASNSASAASTSATNASNSASAASTSATNASNSASAAATSATNAAASYDSFDDRYLGAKSSNPTVDNDGNTLLVGALYFNSTNNEMRVWDGSSWLVAYVSLSGALLATNNLSDLNNTATARTNLGVAIGTNVQAWDADLDTWATKTAPTGTVVGTSDSQTLTNKTIALGSNTVSGTLSQFNTAVTDADLVSIAGSETLTNKTLTSPTINTATISGGTINNTAIGGTTAAAGTFTSLTDSGNLTFTGTGNRITGDFSNATISNRTMFQNSTTDAVTALGFIPNGTATQTNLEIYNKSDPNGSNNPSMGQVLINSTEYSIRSSIRGSGTYLPITMYTGGSERLRIDTSGNVGIGTSSPNTKLEVTGTVRATNSGSSGYFYRGYRSGTTSAWYVYDSGTEIQMTVEAANPLLFGTSNTERMRIASNGALGFSGANYGTSGQVLTSNGSGSAPSWASVPAVSVTPANVSDQANTSTGYFDLPSGTTAQRPASPDVGMVRFNTTTGYPEWYSSSASAWVNFNDGIPYSVSYLVAAGGGGGGFGSLSGGGGGGGAGGLRTGSLTVTAGSVYQITVGAGGAAAASAQTTGSSGSNSAFHSITSTGGGGGGGGTSNATAGGSGGGAPGGTTNRSGGSGTSGQGNAGGSTGATFYRGSAGGGGAGAVGSNPSSINGAAGGAGSASSITGSSVTYAGGGGGGAGDNGGSGGAGGSGGGGTGGNGSTPTSGTAGSANTGGGGGGGGTNSGSNLNVTGSAGGSGVVILSIPTTSYSGLFSGNPTVTTSGSNTILTFTTSGTYTA